MKEPFKNRTAVIFASRPVKAGMRQYVPEDAFVIAADAGWQQAQALGLRVDLAVGDFDSSPVPQGVPEVMRLPAEKDDTDALFAAKEALKRGFGRVVLLGALGGRGDHAFANWQVLLYLAGRGAKALAADEGFELRCMAPGLVRIEREGWRWLSVFAAGGPAAGVTLKGVKYPLDKALLTPDVPLGVSNEFAAPVAEISCDEGYLYVVTSRDGDGDAD